jgi:hypothetical protein
MVPHGGFHSHRWFSIGRGHHSHNLDVAIARVTQGCKPVGALLGGLIIQPEIAVFV